MRADCNKSSIEESNNDFMQPGDVECLVSLLNEGLLCEVVEERVVNLLCCNVVSCQTPEMTDE